MARRTDLALEEKELFEESESTKLSGVISREEDCGGLWATVVEIVDEAGAEALHKPIGTYITVELSDYARKKQDSFAPAVEAIAHYMTQLMGEHQGTVLVVGLGNKAITADAVGPLVTEQMFVTRHLVDHLPDYFGDYRPTCVIAPGVLGMTGMESAEVVQALVNQMKPACVIAVDALASRNLGRVCTTVQLSDTGITPGSGVQNARAALNRQVLGVPVVAVGVPTVVEVATLATDYNQEGVLEACDGMAMVVTPRDIDAKVLELSKAISYGLNMAIHPQLTMDDIAYFVP
ncbi:MAG: GPR endopeptidase [Eubacteriales bacterium]